MCVRIRAYFFGIVVIHHTRVHIPTHARTHVQEVVALLVTVARRVHADYHARALVHADITPSNVLIRTDGGVALIDAVNPARRRP